MLQTSARRPALLAVLLLGLALVAAVARPVAAAHARYAAGAPSVLVVGDSLAVGLKPYLGDLLGENPTWDAVSGRTTPQGMTALRGALRRIQPRTVIVSLGTNDGPDPERFRDRMRRTLAAMPQAQCVVWSALSRPPRKGPFLAMNQVLREEAQRDHRLVIVAWDRVVARGQVTLPDGLHPDPAGYRTRSRMIADAVDQHCDVQADGETVVAPTGGTPAG